MQLCWIWLLALCSRAATGFSPMEGRPCTGEMCDEVSFISETLSAVTNNIKDMVGMKRSIFRLENWNKLYMDDLKRFSEELAALEKKISDGGRFRSVPTNANEDDIQQLKETQKGFSEKLSAMKGRFEEVIAHLSYDRRQRQEGKPISHADGPSGVNNSKLEDQLSSQSSRLDKADEWIEITETKVQNISENLKTIDTACKIKFLSLSYNISFLDSSFSHLNERFENFMQSLLESVGKEFRILGDDLKENKAFNSNVTTWFEDSNKDMKKISEELVTTTEKLESLEKDVSILKSDENLENLTKKLAPIVLSESKDFTLQTNEKLLEQMSVLTEDVRKLKEYFRRERIEVPERLENTDRIEKNWSALKDKFEDREFMKNGELPEDEKPIRQTFSFDEAKNLQNGIITDNSSIGEKLNPDKS